MKLGYTMLILGSGVLATAGVTAAENPGTKVQGMKMEASAPVSVNRAKGVVKELDAKKGTVTLAHEAVPALKWPAMTMAFRVPPQLAKGVEVGQKVDFEFEAKGMAGTITRISPAR